ncbi:MAG: hypothetical protein ACQEP9_03225 [Bacillota bacterium]
MVSNDINNDNKPSYSADLLTKILVEYPAINTINIDLGSDVLQITFLIKRKVSDKEWQKIKDEFNQQVKVFNKLENNNNFTPKLSNEKHNTLSKVKLFINLKELNQLKIDFSINAIEKYFSSNILKAEIKHNKSKLESIEELLQLTKTEPENKYRAFRDENRIFIFAINS